MSKSVRWLVFGLFLSLCSAAVAGPATLHDARLWATKTRTRVVFDLSNDTQPDIFMIDNPLRLVIDLPHTHKASASHVAGQASGSGLIKDIRTGIHQRTGLRLVLDLSQMVSAKSFMLAPHGNRGYRLVLDLRPGHRHGADAGPGTQVASRHGSGDQADDGANSGDLAPGDDSDTTADKTAAAMAQASSASPEDNASRASIYRRGPPNKDIVIAIDAGHGGKDPGAHGPHGSLEKNVTLAIARRLKAMVDEQPHMRGVLTRTGDYYVGLRQRMVIARRDKVDFFISIHCDASPGGGGARGASVYALSAHGATGEHARWLARRENAADLVGGVSLKDKNSSLASFMLDLSQNASIEASLDAGKRVLAQLDELGTLHKSRVQQAGFMVLKSPDIPSLLVETNFISNASEERKLDSSSYQNALARAMLRGIKGYFASYRPATFIAENPEHQVKPGDTLSAIALEYGVSVAALRDYNKLDNDVIHVGATLKIPPPKHQQVAGLP